MVFDKITFEGVDYPTFEVEVNGIVEVCSVVTLANKLLDEDGRYVNDDASIVDDAISFYVEEKDLQLSDEDLIALVRENIG